MKRNMAYEKAPLYQKIYKMLRDEIKNGERKKGEKIPSIRALSERLCVSKSTVERAYEQLVMEGYVVGVSGSGYRVEERTETTDGPKNGDYLDELLQKHRRMPVKEHRIKYDFQYANLDANSFPYELWKKYTKEALLSHDITGINHYTDQKGDPLLRQQLCRYVREMQGISCVPEQIVICSGLQDALGKLCKLFPRAHRVVAMEEPGYDLARAVFASNEYTVLPLPVVEDGWQLFALKEQIPGFLYVTPAHQLPLGCVFSRKSKEKLLQWAHQNDSYIIEDGYSSEFQYQQFSVPLFQMEGNHETGKVIYMNTFSQTLSPSLRLNYMILPNTLMEQYEKTYEGHYSTVSHLPQRIVGLYMQDGHLERHVRRMRVSYRQKRDILLQSIRNTMGNRVKVMGENAGLHILLSVTDGRDQDELVQLAAENGVRVYPVRSFWHIPEECPPGLVMLGFAELSLKEIKKGIELLSHAWFGV